MPIKIEIAGENYTQTLDELMGLSRGLVHRVNAEPVSPAAPAAPETPPADVEAPKRRGRPKTVVEPAPQPAPEPAPIPAITATPEDRVNPEDEADEAAEQAQEAEARPQTTREDVRAAIAGYLKRYGHPAGETDIPKLLQDLFGEGVVRLSLIPDDPAVFDRCIAALKAATANNPFKRAVV